MTLVQLDLFEITRELQLPEGSSIANEAMKIARDAKDSGEKVRKGIYAKSNALAKKCSDLEERLAILERYICQT